MQSPQAPLDACVAVDLLHSKSFAQFVHLVRTSRVKDALYDDDGWSCMHWAA
jgi:hypothetical protein